ncbi:Branched-chain-amino-acid aminotransferase [Paenibacillus sp. CECT 9249]|uniref:aminodeoxychorismate lyase n=1 Tax=Paenibacillus sp. CECT 9249 TaxID=2845385 RepID=UPI001E2F025C|nr:aminodeoxychorismate lyase [Paenibacillus sp. CECT 9249]CAH0121547.1 Branched-chain-amino-acid aminotransferase [Paenibacillus sp. CECT 9249]
MKYIGFNGEVVERDKAVISVLDHGFLYGIGLFETMRTYGGKPFMLERHLRRLADGCRALGIDRRDDPEQAERHIAELLRANGLQDGYVRYTVSAGEGALGLPSEAYTAPNTIVYAKALPDPPASLYTHGKPLQLLRTRRNSPEGDVRLKSAHYMNNIMAKRELARYSEAQRAGAEGLMLNEAGYVAEGIVSNVFFIRGGVCRTPDVATGILPGITRALVLEDARHAGIAVEEGFYTWDDLLQADEIFITNSIQELVPVQRLYDTERNERIVGDGAAGPVTALLLQLYRSRIAGQR